MPLIQTTLMADLAKNMENRLETWRRSVLRQLTIAGEKAVNAARDPHDGGGKPRGPYTDRSGNLRSSVGYVIVEDGRVVARSPVPPIMDGSEGNLEWADYANSLVANFPAGIVLIVVAGMKYAAYVSARGFNVLDSAERIAAEVLKELF